MLRFFRQIRQRLLIENRASKYLLYAVGEILLVVIGILIALQIDGWNDGRKLKAYKMELIDRFQRELNLNIEDTQYWGEGLGGTIDDITQLLCWVGRPQDVPSPKVFDSLLASVVYDWQSPINVEVFIEARNTGELDLIQNDSLNSKIRWLLTVLGTFGNQLEIINIDNNSNVIPYLNRFVNWRNVKAVNFDSYRNSFGYSQLDQTDVHSLLMNREFENLLNQRLGALDQIRYAADYVRSEFIAIKGLLEKENL